MTTSRFTWGKVQRGHTVGFDGEHSESTYDQVNRLPSPLTPEFQKTFAAFGSARASGAPKQQGVMERIGITKATLDTPGPHITQTSSKTTEIWWKYGWNKTAVAERCHFIHFQPLLSFRVEAKRYLSNIAQK